ncbi:MAG: class I SAM-dependent methyltransferase [Alphaproteobacteria bacterium]
MSSRSWRGRWMLAQTLLGRRRGVFIPYRYADALRLNGAGSADGGADSDAPAYPEMATVFAACDAEMAALLETVESHAADLLVIAGEDGHDQTHAAGKDSDAGARRGPRFDQGWFPTLDAAVAYGLVRREQPKRVVEAGSGHSTRFLARAVRDGGLATAITAIDPAPRAPLPAGVRHIAGLVERSGTAPWDGLEAGDLAVIDSSHVAVAGGDVDFLFGRILPRLAEGVVVHVHDVFLPDGYPAAWAWRGYGEQSLVAALLAGGGWRVLFASHWAAQRFAQSIAGGVVRRLPHHPAAQPTSLWLRKIAPAVR